MRRTPLPTPPRDVNEVSVTESTIDGRYQIITRIAAGGMGEVFRAHDAVLSREVALKVLHPHLAGDRGFVERFRREARAAAMLNHPSIVGVYDWGTTEGTYFMIMEYVQGTNLRALLSRDGRLEPAQVIEIVLPVLLALDHAHGHGIVHRDIKPENILIAQDGTVKVADFGLARAYADSYVSQAEGTVTGTVQYLAPEQVQGDPADPRTDLYALGIVLFELLTGSPPFTGETSLAIAYQHLSGKVPPPSEIVPTLEPALDHAVLWATAKERDDRPASARALRDEVVRAAVGLPPAPGVAELAAQIPATEQISDDRAATVTIPRRESPRARRARRFRLITAVVAVALAVGAGAWAGWVYVIPHYTRVPNVLGLAETQAVARLRSAGLSPAPDVLEFSTSFPNGDVIRTTPPVGARVRKRAHVVLYISKGPQLLTVPNVQGLAVDDARQAITDVGFTPVVESAYDDTVPDGDVISQNPNPGQAIVKGNSVTLTVSKGPAPVRIPNLANQPANEASTTLTSLGFQVRQRQEFSTDANLGDVIRTAPKAGTNAPKGSTVTLIVSKGPRSFALPSVVGASKDAAQLRLEGLGLSVNAFPIPNPGGRPVGEVLFQVPGAGTIVHQGDQVAIYYVGS
jgi:beta-lactam-binding protein with PASTA domain/predicted Ser/Thr protein kinase